MKIFEIYVTGQSMQIMNRSDVYSDSRGYLGIRFSYSSDWDGFTKVCRFVWKGNAYEVLQDGDGVTVIPTEVIKPPYFIVAVGGYKNPDFIPTVGLKIPVTDNGYGDIDVDIDASEPATASLLAQILEAYSGTVPKTRKIANVDLDDDITKEELLEAINAEDGAEENVIEGIKLAGTDLTPDENKNVNITDIPKSALANDVKASLEKADSAIQEHQDISGKQDVLTFDDVPTENSNNPVKSGGLFTALARKQDKIVRPAFYYIPTSATGVNSIDISLLENGGIIGITNTPNATEITAGNNHIFVKTGDFIMWQNGSWHLISDKVAISELHSAIGAVNTDLQSAKGRVSTIESKIPSQATSQNQLADKEFVNSSIATETAHYISNNGQPFSDPANLPTDSSVTNNDYAIVTGTDAEGNTYYDRYKATVSNNAVNWAKEFRLNNSSFTAEQWATISSGITSALVNKLSNIDLSQYYTKSEANTLLSDKVDKVAGKGLSTNDYDNTEKAKVASAYQKPQNGIPQTDLSTELQSDIEKARRVAMYGKDVTPTDDSYFNFTLKANNKEYSISPKYISGGVRTVSWLNDMTSHTTYVYTVSDSGILTSGNVEVIPNDRVIWDSTNSVWEKYTTYPVLPNNLVIPYEYNGKPVTSIDNFGFNDCTSITSLVFPKSIKNAINIVGGSYIFKRCTALTSILLQSELKRVEGESFNGCTSLTTVDIPDGITVIDAYSFNGCTNLEKMTIPDSVTDIGRQETYPTLTNCPKLVVYCNQGSYAEGYCIRKNIPYICPEITSNKVTSLSAQSTDEQYPTAKAVYDAVSGELTDAKRLAALLRMGCTVDENGFVKWTAQPSAE